VKTKMKTLFLYIIAAILIFSGCSTNKTPLTSDGFKEKMEEAGFEIYDITDQYEEGLLDAAFVTMKEDYKLEFYVLNTSDDAKAMYNANKSDFEDLRSGNSAYNSVNLGNHASYKLTTEDGYYVVSRIDNTLVFVKTDKKNKDAINKVLKDLGY
jgi:roadblock/LC7 domain-containing protein